MRRSEASMHRDHRPCDHMRHREGLMGDRFDRDDRGKMRGRHGLQGGRHDDMHGRCEMEHRRERRHSDCCW